MPRKRNPDAPAKPPGPKTKLDRRMLNLLVETVRAGATKRDAARRARIHESTLYYYLEQGEADFVNDKASLTSELYEALTGSTVEADLELIAHIRKAAQEGDWRAAAWMLERKNPAEWGRAARPEGLRPEELDEALDLELERLQTRAAELGLDTSSN